MPIPPPAPMMATRSPGWAGHGNRLFAVGRLGNDFVDAEIGNQLSQPFTCRLLVIDYQDLHRLLSS
jgi:hypothetical protein